MPGEFEVTYLPLLKTHPPHQLRDHETTATPEPQPSNSTTPDAMAQRAEPHFAIQECFTGMFFSMSNKVSCFLA